MVVDRPASKEVEVGVLIQGRRLVIFVARVVIGALEVLKLKH